MTKDLIPGSGEPTGLETCVACGRSTSRQEAYRELQLGGRSYLLCCPMCWSAFEAGRIQRQLISPPYISDRIRISVDYEPALQVGGDYTCIRRREGDRLFLMAADVSGHGVKPSLLVSRLSGEIETMAAGDLSPASIALRLQERVLEIFAEENLYLTFFGAVIDLASRHIEYSNCGHPAGLLWSRTEGRFQRLSSHHLPVGLVSGEEFGLPDVLCLGYQAGDELILFTDGITESPGHDGKEVGVAGLEEMSQAYFRSRDEGVDGSLFDFVRSRMANRPDDDLLMLVCELR